MPSKDSVDWGVRSVGWGTGKAGARQISKVMSWYEPDYRSGHPRENFDAAECGCIPVTGAKQCRALRLRLLMAFLEYLEVRI